MGNLKSRGAKIRTKPKPSPGANNEGPTKPKILRMEPPETTSPPTSPQDHTETGNSTNNTGYKENTDPPPRTSPTRRGEATSPDHTQSSDSTSPQTTKVPADGQPVPTPTMDGKGTPPAKNQPTSQKRAVILSLEEDNGMKILQRWTKSFINDCELISSSTMTKYEDWRSDVEKYPIVLFYSSSSMSSIEKMKSHMENGISRKGHQAVIVVIRNIQEDSEEKVRSQLGISGYPEFELHMFTKTEWLLQDPRLQEMAEKIKKIRDPLSGGSQKRNLNKESNNLKDSQNRKNGAIFFIQDTPQEKSHWLEPVLRTDDKMNFTVTEISKIKKLPSRVKESGPINCILHFKKENFHKMTKKENSGATAIDGKNLQHLDYTVDYTMVVVDDVDDDGSEDDLRALYKKIPLSQSAPLVVFRREEKQEEFLAYFSSNNDAAVTAQEKWSKLQKSIETRVKASCLPPDTEEMKDIRNFTTVGIFSRSSNIDYSWMENILMSPDLHLPISRVRCFCISNNQTLQIFEELNLCTFGVLYHTKNRGRVNVTDVTDSLYDEELEIMSSLLGRNNVIVVIDDLTDNSFLEKNRILKSQPSIERYAYNLLLVTEKEKKDKPRLVERLREALIFKGEEKDCRVPVEEKSTSQHGGNQPIASGRRKRTTKTGDNQSPPVDEKSTSQLGDNQSAPPVDEKSTSPQGDIQSAPPVDQKSTSQLGDIQSAPPVDQKSTSQLGDIQSAPPVDQKSTSQLGDIQPKAPGEKKRTIEPVDDQMAENKQPEESKNDTEENVSKSDGKVSNRDSEKKLKSERDSKKEPESKQDSKKEPESKEDSEKKSDINQNDLNYCTQL